MKNVLSFREHTAFLHSASSGSTARAVQHFSVCGDAKSECSSGNTENMPGGLFARATFNFSFLTRVISHLLQICIVLLNISNFIHEICIDRVALKDFCNYF